MPHAHRFIVYTRSFLCTLCASGLPHTRPLAERLHVLASTLPGAKVCLFMPLVSFCTHSRMHNSRSVDTLQTHISQGGARGRYCTTIRAFTRSTYTRAQGTHDAVSDAASHCLLATPARSNVCSITHTLVMPSVAVVRCSLVSRVYTSRVVIVGLLAHMKPPVLGVVALDCPHAIVALG